ncbi:YqgQ family protein [Sediminibacillus massiliensis]|uniref:YqgQ family protein n=1 Tax=Sediminibacillus massiliensis TaxID=1926277 RepID=UPI0009885883|nr:YqgQ family protein [Sediminibacillus massiliensis]
MKTIYDVRQLLKKFGTIIYLGDRLADLEMMEDELRELFVSQFITSQEYQMAISVLQKEKQNL